MSIQLELIDDETLALSFPYDAGLVASLKTLQIRRWNPRKRHWEVHLSHLADIMRIFSLTPHDLSEPILTSFRLNWSASTLKVELNSLEGRLTGPNLPFERVDEISSYYVPGYKFSPKYQAKKWDGKRHLFNRRRRTFPAGLWSRIKELIDTEGIPYTVEEEAPATRRKARLRGFKTGPTVLRAYQKRVLTKALQARRGIIQIATGGGKTLLAAHLIRRIKLPTFFFVHTLELLYQTSDVFREELGQDIGILGDGQARLCPITVTTIQTAVRAFVKTPPAGAESAEAPGEDVGRSERFVELDEATREQIRDAINAAELVIFDECHHLPADSFYKVAMQTSSAHWRFGLSATPWRDDASDMLLEAALGGKISVVNCSDLISKGYLVRPRLRMVPAPPPPRLAPGMRYPDLYQRAIVENQDRNRVIAAQAEHWVAEGRSVLILVAQVAHGKQIKALLPEANFAYGALDSAVRQRYLKELEQKLHPILIATTLADEGLDLPTLDAVILAGGGKSQTRAYQRIGRALRPAQGKSEALVMDFLDDAPYLRAHSQARLALYRQEPAFLIQLIRRSP